MKITIEFDTDNAAFEEDYDGAVEAVLADALDIITIGANPGDTDPLRDINGNTVGEVRFS